jgi:hypothetical protein
MTSQRHIIEDNGLQENLINICLLLTINILCFCLCNNFLSKFELIILHSSDERAELCFPLPTPKIHFCIFRAQLSFQEEHLLDSYFLFKAHSK